MSSMIAICYAYKVIFFISPMIISDNLCLIPKVWPLEKI
jgi:hypothetical protein